MDLIQLPLFELPEDITSPRNLFMFTEEDFIHLRNYLPYEILLSVENLQNPTNYVPLYDRHIQAVEGKFSHPYCNSINKYWRATAQNNDRTSIFKVNLLELEYEHSLYSPNYNRPTNFLRSNSKTTVRYKPNGENSGVARLGDDVHIVSHLIIGCLDEDNFDPQNPQFIFISNFKPEHEEIINQTFPNMAAIKIRKENELDECLKVIESNQS